MYSRRCYRVVVVIVVTRLLLLRCRRRRCYCTLSLLIRSSNTTCIFFVFLGIDIIAVIVHLFHTTTTTIRFEIVNTSVVLLLFMNSIRCTPLSVPVSRPVRVLLSAFFLLYYWYWSYYSNHPWLLWLIFTTKQIIVITRRVRSTVSIRLFIVSFVSYRYLFSSLYLSFRFCSSPTPTDNTAIPSSDRGIDTQLDSNAPLS